LATEVIMPALSPAQETGILIEWFKEEGDLIEKGEPLMEVETDKANVEVEATTTGILANITVNLGDEIPVGKVIALILADGESVLNLKKNILPPKQKSLKKIPLNCKLQSPIRWIHQQIFPQTK